MTAACLACSCARIRVWGSNLQGLRTSNFVLSRYQRMLACFGYGRRAVKGALG